MQKYAKVRVLDALRVSRTWLWRSWQQLVGCEGWLAGRGGHLDGSEWLPEGVKMMPPGRSCELDAMVTAYLRRSGGLQMVKIPALRGSWEVSEGR